MRTGGAGRVARGAALLAAPLMGSAAGVAQAAPPPDPGAATRAAQYGLVEAPLHYAGAVQGGEVARPGFWGATPDVPPGSGPERRLRVGLYPPDAQGRVVGSALLLDAQGSVLVGGAVEGVQRGQACRLHVVLGSESDVLDGTCNLAQLSGSLTRRTVRTGFSLVRFLAWKAGERSDGEAWLAAE